MKYIPLIVVFVLLVVVCVGSRAAATYLEFFRDPPLPHKDGQPSPVAGLWVFGVLTGLVAGWMAVIFACEE